VALIEQSAKSRLAVNAVLVMTDVAPNHGTTGKVFFFFWFVFVFCNVFPFVLDAEGIIRECGLAQAQQRRELRISQRLPADMDHPWVLHTFGYGSLHDSEVLSEVASAAKGVYSFIHQGELVSNAVADCFGALASSVALRLEICVRPAIGCDLKAVRTAYKVTEYDNGYVIDIGDIHRGEATNILMDLHVDKLEGAPVGEQQLVDIHVKYLDLRFQDPVVAGTRLFTSVDVFRPQVVPKQTPVTSLDLQDMRYNTYFALKKALADSAVSKKARQKAASELARLAAKYETSVNFETKLCKSVVRDLLHCSELLRKDPTEDYLKVLRTTYCQHGFERSVGRPLDDYYSTSSRAAAQLRVGRSLRQGLARLLESAKYSDMVVAGNKVHRAILSARCPAALELTEIDEEDAEAFKVVLRFIYSGDYIAQRRGLRDRVVDLKFRVLALAKRLQLDMLVSLARQELIEYARIDIKAVQRALEVGESIIVEHWIYNFVHKPDQRSAVQQEELSQVPQIISRVVQEMRVKAMDRPEDPEIPMREPLAADIVSLFNSGEHSDMNLKVITNDGNMASFKVHKCVLFSRAPWFAFQDLSKPLPIKVTPRAFRSFLEYLYSEEAPSNMVDGLHIIGSYATAGIDSIQIAKYIITNLNSSNCYEAYATASALGLRGLSRAALDVVEDNYEGNTRQYVESTQKQINQLTSLVHALADRVMALENGNVVSDDESDDRD
jgi:hypothetical protein